ncbi:ABC transporter permease [Bauldia sp.]|uniref:ABC transporter permease n=1 Tax=Bauldia sp. TaxID=2575872 RepID=UPI003BAC5482
MAVSDTVNSAPQQSDSGQAAEARFHQSLSYGQLVRRRFMSNTYGVAGLALCLFVILTAIFAGFIAPYSTTNTDSTALYAPPQWVKIIGPEGQLMRPFVYGVTEEMDPTTFEITFANNPDDVIPIEFFVRGEPWTFLGMTFTMHLFGGADGKRVSLLGTDNLGRDVFSRMIWGTRVTLMMGFLVMVAACIIGTIVGVSAGYFGGMFDLISQRIVEFFKAFPDLPLYLALVALLPRRADPELVFLMFAAILVLLRWADLARELRGKVFAMRRLDYIRAAEAVGAKNSRILGRHILPNVTSHVIVWATYYLPEIILLESFLSFLGVGVQAPMVSWGSMLNQILDFQSFSAAPWMMSPVIMIIISVLAFNAFGDGLRDAIDPYSDA